MRRESEGEREGGKEWDRGGEREGKNPLLGKQQILVKPLAKLKFCNNNSA